MADCESPTLSVPDLTCNSDIPTWATALVASLQAAIDHVVGCVQDAEVPQCDICSLKDDLASCPLIVNMIDFADIVYGAAGGVGVLPRPTTLSDYEFRNGTGTVTPAYSEAWRSVSIVFDEAFSTSCLYVGITVTAMPGGDSGVDVNGTLGGIVVTEKSVTGFTVYIYRADLVNDSTVLFDYFAVGN